MNICICTHLYKEIEALLSHCKGVESVTNIFLTNGLEDRSRSGLSDTNRHDKDSVVTWARFPKKRGNSTASIDVGCGAGGMYIELFSPVSSFFLTYNRNKM